MFNFGDEFEQLVKNRKFINNKRYRLKHMCYYLKIYKIVSVYIGL